MKKLYLTPIPRILSGTAIMLATIWVGSYLNSIVSGWAQFPAVTTAFVVFVGGLILLMSGCSDYFE